MGDIGDLLMPKLGLTMTEGTVARWLVAPGERFSAGDTIVVIETDKIANDVEAPAAGEMTAVLSSEGDVVPVGAPIARWRLDGGAAAARASSPHPSAIEGSDAAPLQTLSVAYSRSATERIVATPYARRLARETGLDLARVTGSGPRGRIKALDILRAREANAPSHQLAQAAPAVARAARSVAQPATFSFLSADVDVSSLRAIDARLAATRDRPFERLAYIALACTKALAGDGDEPVRLGIETKRTLSVFECTPRDTLSTVAARSMHAQPGTSGGDIAIFIAEGRTRLLVPAISPGWRMALGAGGVRALRGGNTSHEMTLTIAYDGAVMDHASVAQILDRIAALLEEPLQLLAT